MGEIADAIVDKMCDGKYHSGYTRKSNSNGGNKINSRKPNTPPRSRTTSQPTANPVSLAVPEAKFQPPRIVLYATEGWGKTTFGAYALKPAFLMAKGENGYETLLGMGTVPECPAATIDSWSTLLATLDSFIEAGSLPDGCKTLVLDALNGYEKLCHEHVCNVEFGGDWGDKGFMSFHKGYGIAVTHWLQFLNRLDKINQLGVMIICLDHAQVKTHQNPMGPDFDQYLAACHPKTMAATAKWCDAILFGKYNTIVDTERGKKKGKGVGGNERVIYTSQCDAFQAKNRYNMPECIEIPDDHTLVHSTVWHWIYTVNFKPKTAESAA